MFMCVGEQWDGVIPGNADSHRIRAKAREFVCNICETFIQIVDIFDIASLRVYSEPTINNV